MPSHSQTAKTRKADIFIYALAYTTAMRLVLVHHIHPARVQHQQRYSYDEV